MICEVCKQEQEKGQNYKFLAVVEGETTETKTGAKQYTYATLYMVSKEKSGFVCRRCFWQSLLLSEVGLVIISTPIFYITLFMEEPVNLFLGILEFLIYNFVMLIPLVLVIIALAFGGNFFFSKFGARALIRAWRNDSEYKPYKLMDRGRAAKIGLIDDEFSF